MLIGYDFWLLLLSATLCSLTIYFSCRFVKRIYLSTPVDRSTLLPAYSFSIGSMLFGLNNLSWVAMRPIASNQLSVPMLLASLFAAIFATFIVFANASEKRIPFNTLINRALIVGLLAYAMFYLSFVARHPAENISIDVGLLFTSLLFASLVAGCTILYYFKMNHYADNRSVLVKDLLSVVIASLMLGVYSVFNATLSVNEHVLGSIDKVVTNRDWLATLISLSIAGLLALTIRAPKYYEKLKTFFSEFHVIGSHAVDDLNAKDVLTQLANRRGFEMQLNLAVKRSVRKGKTIALAYIDLDHFKPINDNYGHHVGDAVLIAVAQRLNKTVRVCDFVARLGGDEFVAIIEDITFDEDITPIIGRIVDSIKESFNVKQHHIEISCSVGVAVYPGDGDIEKLMVCADAAMYKAKENGKNQFKFFDAEIELASEQMLEMHHDLRQAIDNNEFILVYQPKVDCKTQQPVGAEALIRWNHPSKGELAPTIFLPAAERFGLINKINDWVIEEACRAIYRAKVDGFDLNISINLACQQFRNPNLVVDILNILNNYDIPSNNLMFEIKETTSIRNEIQFNALLDDFKDANLKVSLDDFGSHNFNLSYLQSLNISELKLDRIFVAQINDNKTSHALIDAVIRLAHALEFNVVAEGVENESQRKALADLGCDQMQGFLFSKAVDEQKLFNLFHQLSANFESTGQFNLADYQAHK
jgi:diguanylate cyclase